LENKSIEYSLSGRDFGSIIIEHGIDGKRLAGFAGKTSPEPKQRANQPVELLCILEDEAAIKKLSIILMLCSCRTLKK
jgi:hypothetical protein